MKDITEQLYDLNEKFYKLFGRLKSNEGALVSTQNKEEFANSIMGIYKIEAKKLLISYEGEQAPALYLLEYLAAAKKPRRGLFRRNRAMKVLDDQLVGILDDYFDTLKVQSEAEELPHAEPLPETSEAAAAHLEAAEQSVVQLPVEPAPKKTSDPKHEAEVQPAEQQTTDPLTEQSEAPAVQSESDPTQSLKKKHKRGNKDTQSAEQSTTSEAMAAPTEASKQLSEPLKLEEVPTDGGAQICLHIP